MCRLAVYLAPIVEDRLGGWSVDVEYNRVSPGEYSDAAYKYLLDVLGEPVKPAYPDLIVHKRGVRGIDGGNLLVVEAKRNPNDRQRLEDHAKLVAWTRELYYIDGARLEFGEEQMLCAWISARDDQRALTPAVAFRQVQG